MARRKTQFAESEYYHIFNRGCNRGRIFFEEENYVYLLNRLRVRAIRYQIAVIAYCLMPNHYHFLLRQDGSTSVTVLIQDIFNSYTKAVNKRYHRSGTLFEGPFKSIHVDKEGYLLHLCRYIHRNPLDGKLVRNIEAWKYSNYLDCIGKRSGGLLDPGFIVHNFGSTQMYEHFVLEYKPPDKVQKELGKFLLA